MAVQSIKHNYMGIQAWVMQLGAMEDCRAKCKGCGKMFKEIAVGNVHQTTSSETNNPCQTPNDYFCDNCIGNVRIGDTL